MRVATFNANSVRVRLPIILDWLAEFEPDVLALQETKCEDSKFPVGEFEEWGWHATIHGQRARNGVALISRTPLTHVSTGFGDPLFPEDCRIVTALASGVAVVNTYVPNGTEVGSEKFEYKLRWLERFGRYLAERFKPTDPVVWLGDINIAPTPDDVYNSPRFLGGVGHHPEEFARLEAIRGFGLVDVFRKFHEGPGHYTFWDFVVPNAVERNRGWRIDHIYLTERLAAKCTACEVDRAPRSLDRPSDHTFVYADLDL